MTIAGKITFLIVCLLTGLAVYIHFTIGFWGDQDWELLVAGMLLDGKHLYIDHFTVSPPLIYYLYTLPEALARHMAGVQDFKVLVLVTLLVAAGSIALCCRLLDVHEAFASPAMHARLIQLLCLLLIFRIASAYFGDREHLFILLTLPYLLRWMPSLARREYPLWIRLLTGVMAGIGFSMKPHCLIAFTGIQVAALVRKDRPAILFSAENLVIYAVFALYLMFIALCTPLYFSTVLPMAALTYGAISAGSGGAFDMTILITLLLTFLFFKPRATSPFRRDIYYLLIVSVFLLAYGASNRGWGYTYQPVLTLLLIANGFVLWEFLYLRAQAVAAGQPVVRVTCGALSCLLNFAAKIAVALVYFAAVLAQPCHGDAACPGYYAPFAQALKGERSFGTIGMNFALWARAAKLTGAQWVTRFPQFWMLPKFLISGSGFYDEHKAILRTVTDALADDLNNKKPQLMFVAISDTLYTIHLPQPLDWVREFSVYPAFAQAWGHYRYDHTVDNCGKAEPAAEVAAAMTKQAVVFKTECRFAVYRRSD